MSTGRVDGMVSGWIVLQIGPDSVFTGIPPGVSLEVTGSGLSETSIPLLLVKF